MSFRQPNHRELAILGRLLESPFPGRNELIEQLDGASVRTIEEHQDNYGSIEFRISSGAMAPVRQRVPVEATGHDNDGCEILHLLHVEGGLLFQLEILKMDGTPIIRHPDPAELDVFIPYVTSIWF